MEADIFPQMYSCNMCIAIKMPKGSSEMCKYP